MQLSRPYPISSQGLIYSLMCICAVAIVAFSVIGTASMSGIAPPELNSGSEIEKALSAFQCAECGVIDSLRDMQLSNDAPAPTLTPGVSSMLR